MMQSASRRSARLVSISLFAATSASSAFAVPPPPPPPDVLARIEADCRVPPAETIPLAKTAAPVPSSPAALNLGWGIRLTPPAGSHIGRVVGITSTWSGSIVAATDRGYWIRVPSASDESRAVPPQPVAVSIRDLPGEPWQMAFAGWTGEPGYVGLNVLLAVKNRRHLIRYQIGGCFPGARPVEETDLPAMDGLVRLLPSAGTTAVLLMRGPDGRLETETGSTDPKPASKAMAATSLAADIPLATGCDEMLIDRRGGEAVVSTRCSPAFSADEADLWAKPQRQHRQPTAIPGEHRIGVIDAPIVAISEAHYHFAPRADAVARGDPSDPGQPCSLLLAAQAAPDAPIVIYGAQPYCAYWPRDPSGAPFPPPPPAD